MSHFLLTPTCIDRAERHYDEQLKAVLGPYVLELAAQTKEATRGFNVTPEALDRIEPVIARAAREACILIADNPTVLDAGGSNHEAWRDLRRNNLGDLFTRAFALEEAGKLDTVEAYIADSILTKVRLLLGGRICPVSAAGMQVLDTHLVDSACAIKPLLAKQVALF